LSACFVLDPAPFHPQKHVFLKNRRIVTPTYATIGRAVSEESFLGCFGPISGAQKHGGNAGQSRLGFWKSKFLNLTVFDFNL